MPRLSQEEYELLNSALRAFEQQQDVLVTSSFINDARLAVLAKILPDFRNFAMEQRAKAVRLRERLTQLYHHDCDWLGTDVPRLCLACGSRHAPHCDKCSGCLPEKTPS